MEGLPIEILQQILDLYPFPAQYRLVSTKWRQILTGPTFKQVRVRFKDWSSFATSLSTETIQGFGPYVQELSILNVGRYMGEDGIDKKWTDHVHNALRHFPNLRNVRLTVLPYVWHDFYQSSPRQILIPENVRSVSFLGVPVQNEDQGAAISPITLNALRLPSTLDELEIGGICCCSQDPIEVNKERKAAFIDRNNPISTLHFPHGLHCPELYPLILQCKRLVNLHAASGGFDEGIYQVREEFQAVMASPVANRIRKLELTYRFRGYNPEDFHKSLYWGRIDLRQFIRLQQLKISARYVLWVDSQREAMDVAEARQGFVQSLPCALKQLHITDCEELIARNHTLPTLFRTVIIQPIFHLLRTREQLGVTIEGLDRPGLNFMAALCHLLHSNKPDDIQLPLLLVGRYHPWLRCEGNGTLEPTADWVDSCLHGEERNRVVPLGHPSLANPHPSHAEWLRLYPDDGYCSYKPSFSLEFLEDLKEANRWFRTMST